MRLVFALCAVSLIGCDPFDTHDNDYAFPPSSGPSPAPSSTSSAKSDPPISTSDPFNPHLSKSRYLAVGAGDHYSCAILPNHNVDCWGDQKSGAVGVSEIVTGPNTACGLTSNGTVKCWGTYESSLLDAPSGKLSDLGLGDAFACALDDEQHARCWGPTALTPPADEVFTSLAVGTLHACGLHADGTAVCWGNKLGGSDVPADKFTAIAAGPSTTCGVRIGDDAVVCWGLLTGLQTLDNVSSIAVTKGKVCGIDKGSLRVNCAGLTPNDWLEPPKDHFAQISIGATHACGIRAADGLALCWGSDTDGESTPLY